MKIAKTNDFSDRRSSALVAKAELLRAYRANTDAADPSRLARQEERMAIVIARDARRGERDKLKAEALELQQAEEQRAAEAAAYMDAANVAARAKVESEQKADSMIGRVIKDEATRKADRDKRYADRKARQR
ncbi:MAG: DUF6481 family protein [Paracoccaceae bacterium]|nr:DUF6481 family protein [Paracoccaceae bacterium]